MRRSSWVILVVGGIAGLLLGGRALTALFVNKAWFAALGAEPVFWEQVQDTVILRGGLFIAGSLFALLNLQAVRRTILAVAVPARIANIEVTAMLPARRLIALTAAIAVLVGALLATPFDDWTLVAMARRGLPFRESEFYFQQDLGHYVYWLPLEQMLYVWSLLSVVVLVSIVLVLYALMRSLRLDGRRIVVSTYARRHLTVLGALMMALLAWSYRLDGFDLLRNGSGIDGTFLRVDHLVAVNIDFGLLLLTLFAAMLLLRAGWAGQTRMATLTLTVVLAAAIGVRHGLPIVMSRNAMLGDPVRRELDYVATRALVTRRAYDVDGMTVIPADSTTSVQSRLRLRDLPRVVSIWDAAPLARALGAGGADRVTVAPIAWSPHGGSLQGLLLEKPATGDGAWQLGTVIGTAVDDRGAPMHDGLDVADALDSAAITMADDVSAGFIAQPLIAPDAQGHRLVFDSITRVVGARLNNEGSRIAHAWATRDPRLLRQSETEGVPTLVMWRDVRERVRKLAPIFAQGQDVVPLVYEGALYWTVELYSASDMYPLSQRWLLAGDVRSYFRHAATALVNSRNGRVRLVTVSKPDPVARSWMALAPDLFVPSSALAAGLAEQLPPPTDGTIAQARAFARYGSRLDGAVPRHLPDSIMGRDGPPGILLEGVSPASGWTVPVLNGPEQIAGIAVSAGGARRGTRWMPVRQLDARWGVIAGQLRAALDSSRPGLMEGGRREPQTALGQIRTVLIDGTPAMVQPLYVTRLNQAQALARVSVAYDGNVAVGATTAEAVGQLEGAAMPASANNGTGNLNVPLTVAGRQASVARLYDTMRAALRRGDWSRFGTAFDSLGTLLGRSPE